jgi:hypothetical protein
MIEMTSPGERRADERIGIRRPCKVYDARYRKYWPAETLDLSPRGAMLRIDRPLDMGPGDHLYVGIAATRRQPVVRSREMLEAVVRHVMVTPDDRTIVGVRFEAAHVAPEAAQRAA